MFLRYSRLAMAGTKSSVHHYGGVSVGNVLVVLNDITPNHGRVRGRGGIRD